MAVALLMAGLVIASFVRLISTDAGITTDGRVVARIELTVARWGEENRRVQQQLAGTPQAATSIVVNRMTYSVMWDALLRRVRAIPGVTRATMVSGLPLVGRAVPRAVWLADGPPTVDNKAHDVLQLAVDADYFRILGIPLRRGRLFASVDGPADPPKIIVNETAAHVLWPHQDALGRRLRSKDRGGVEELLEVIGVVGDTRYSDLASLPEPQVFWSSLQDPPSRPLLLIAAEHVGPMIEQGVRRAARDTGVTACEVRPYGAVAAQSVAGRRVVTTLMAVIAFGILLLTVAGVYGAVAQAAAQRSREMAIRASCGAGPTALVAELMRRHFLLACLGSAAGVGFGLAVARLLRASLVPSLSVEAAATWVALTTPLLVVVLVGSVPTLRLVQGDLATRLRDE
jgi:putative ABC transport system permease protein